MSKQPDAVPQPARPYMPGYGVPDEPEGMLDWAWVEQRLTAARNYWICTTWPDGRPHATPVWGAWLDGALYFGASRTSRKARNLAANPAIVVHLESGDEAVILEGAVEEAADRSIFPRLADAYEAKYPGFRPQFEPGELYFRLRPSVVLAWMEKDFLGTPTRWTFDARK